MPLTPSIRIVLVDPHHPGNIGAVARAMKNMALAELVLVRPKFSRTRMPRRAPRAPTMCSRAARVRRDFADASPTAVWSSARAPAQRDLPFDLVEPRECARADRAAGRSGSAAIVFGAERIGLTNEELALQSADRRFPTDPGYSSLNLAMAVQVFAYESGLPSPPAAPAIAAARVPWRAPRR